jgi:hypothetical protein
MLVQLEVDKSKVEVDKRGQERQEKQRKDKKGRKGQERKKEGKKEKYKFNIIKQRNDHVNSNMN